MLRRRPRALMILLSLGAFALALGGCGRRAPSIAPESLVGVAPPPSPSSEAPDGPPFHFPDDAAGALLAKVLPPADVRAPLPEPAAGRRPPAAALPTPAPPLPPGLAPLPPVPAERNLKLTQPRLVAEETLGLGLADPVPPQPRSFAVGDRIRLPSADANQPPPLPILAQPTADRAPLDDPTADASAAAATTATMPQRTNPVPYFRVTLPEPFANRQPLRLPVPPDDAGPRTGTVHPPTP